MILSLSEDVIAAVIDGRSEFPRELAVARLKAERIPITRHNVEGYARNETRKLRELYSLDGASRSHAGRALKFALTVAPGIHKISLLSSLFAFGSERASYVLDDVAVPFVHRDALADELTDGACVPAFRATNDGEEEQLLGRFLLAKRFHFVLAAALAHMPCLRCLDDSDDSTYWHAVVASIFDDAAPTFLVNDVVDELFSVWHHRTVDNVRRLPASRLRSSSWTLACELADFAYGNRGKTGLAKSIGRHARKASSKRAELEDAALRDEYTSVLVDRFYLHPAFERYALPRATPLERAQRWIFGGRDLRGWGDWVKR